jgi:hypothetical protein
MKRNIIFLNFESVATMCDQKSMRFLLVKKKIYDKQSKRGSYKQCILNSAFFL